MSNTSVVATSSCLAPFLPLSDYPDTVGFLPGRFCAGLGSTTCCIPCPKTDYLYPSNFNNLSTTIAWINIIGACCSIFLLASWTFLPKSLTARHYLSICLAIATIFMQLGFIIPLGTKPEFCADAITPNDMHSSLSCALSGAFLLAGGAYGVMWVFMRAFSLHLQICWRRTLGWEFMYASFVVGWGLPAVFLIIAFCLTGVSFRFGSTCHINHRLGLADFWIPLLTLATATVLLQSLTFVYCLKVYINTLRHKSLTHSSSSNLPIYRHTLHSLNPRQAFLRVKKVLELQWRGMVIVLIIIADVVFFATEFIKMDKEEQRIDENPELSIDWLTCIIESAGQTEMCLEEAGKLIISEAGVLAVLILLSLNGIWLFLLMFRTSMLTGWRNLLANLVSTPSESDISKDAVGGYRAHTKPYPPLRTTISLPTKPQFVGTLGCQSRISSPLRDREGVISPLSPITLEFSPVMRQARDMRPCTPDYFEAVPFKAGNELDGDRLSIIESRHERHGGI